MGLDFNGSSSLIGLPVDALLRVAGGPVSFAAWIKADTLKTCGIMHDNKTTSTHRGFWFTMNDASGNLDCNYGDNGGGAGADRRSKVSSSGGPTTGSWFHVACFITAATNMGLYVNGTDIGGTYSGTGGAVAFNAAAGGQIGSVGGGGFFDGIIAEVGFWGVALSVAEFGALARGVSPKMVRPGSLRGHWPLWNASNPTIDLSANSLEASTLTSVTAANHGPVGYPWPVAG